MRVKTQNHDLQEENEEVTDGAIVPVEEEDVNNTLLDDSVSLYQQADADKNADETEQEEKEAQVVEETQDMDVTRDTTVIDPDETRDLDETHDADEEAQVPDDELPAKQTSNTRVSTPASSVVPEDSPSQDVITKCVCGVNEDDGLMILCALCNTWQHATCYAILNPEDAPETHYCVQCSQNSEHGCTDEKLAEITDLQVVQANCLWRRALMAVIETTRILAPTLSKRLGVPLSLATSLLKRLETEGFVKTGGKARRFGKLVQKEEITARGVDKYFKYIVEDENEDVDMVTAKASNLQISRATQENSSSKKGSKRKSGGAVVSTNNTDLRFELADSQQSQSPSQEIAVRKRRKHTSVTAEPMCV